MSLAFFQPSSPPQTPHPPTTANPVESPFITPLLSHAPFPKFLPGDGAPTISPISLDSNFNFFYSPPLSYGSQIQLHFLSEISTSTNSTFVRTFPHIISILLYQPLHTDPGSLFFPLESPQCHFASLIILKYFTSHTYFSAEKSARASCF